MRQKRWRQMISREEHMRAETIETSEDLAHGQIVIVTFRWIMVVAGFLFALWHPEPVSDLRIQLVVIFALAVANFYLHAQLLMRRPALETVVYAASAADIGVITVIVLAGGGFDSGVHIFYYPAILVFSVAFRTKVTYTFAGAAILLYTLVSLGTPEAVEGNLPVLSTRLLMLAAVAACGNIYWRIERDRRRAALEAREALMAQIGEPSAAFEQ